MSFEMFVDLGLGLGWLLVLAIISSLSAMWLKSALNGIKARKEFPDTSEGRALIMNGISKNLRTGKARGQCKPSGFKI